MAQKRPNVLFNKNASPFVPALPTGHFGHPNKVAMRPSELEFEPPQLQLDVILKLPPTAPLSLAQFEEFLAVHLPIGGYTVLQYGVDRAVLLFVSPEIASSSAKLLDGLQWLGGEILTVPDGAAGNPLVHRDSGAFAASAFKNSISKSSDTTGSTNSASSEFLTPPGPGDFPSGPPNYPGFADPLAAEIPYVESPPPGANPYYFMPPPYGFPVDYGYYGGPVPYPPYGYYGVSSASARTPSRRSSSRSLSHQSSANGPTKPSPPFLVNMAKRESSIPPRAPQSAESSPGTDTEDLFSVADDEGNPIKVNPRRLFVGNIPFNSTWPALKNFLITKAEEIEPGNKIDILRVEIPMQQPRDVPKDVSKLNSYQFLTLLSQQLQEKSGPSTPEMARATSIPNGPTRSLSRGFAIVTTANKLSLEKIIKFFDNAEFEGRTLTVRYDRFPDFNNYVLQQLYPSNRNHNKPAFLSNLAFERNSFQQKFYYGFAPVVPYKPLGSRSKRNNEIPPYNELTMDELAGPLDEIEAGGYDSQPLQSPEASDEEKARNLVNSIVARDLST